MKYLLFVFCSILLQFSSSAQQDAPDTTWKNVYRETAPRINNLVHTKLSVSFRYDSAQMDGKAWITLTPHFYPTDSLTLDAKGMTIRKVALVNGSRTAPLKYDYDGMQLRVQLGKTFSRKDEYTVYIDYTARPNDLKTKGSAAITNAKGLYFINPRGEEEGKPVQIWTQGETEATSVWCPTIDKPNQKTTQEIAMTVPEKFVSLSNGKLVSQKKNADGTRTDTWKMDQPHAPYLFFMGVGDYAIVKDSYKGKEVSYYVEKAYAPVARKIFGNTPEMMQFFSRILGMDFPWVKYAQIVGTDYVSGAMENTTATLHQESAQQDARELVDGNIWENTIAHELFHQWFGDLVTTESWSNLTLNESFANYSEYLWKEYKYGKDAADELHTNDMNGYLNSESDHKDLVRYYYSDKEDMFDAVSYNKGGNILHMLRNYVGDSAFFNALNLYLKRHQFGTAETDNLRLAFEEVTGRDLNWFFNQWYYSSGHPKLDIRYQYDDAAGKATVVVEQQQPGKVFRLPIAVDVYQGKAKERHQVWLTNRIDTLTFSYTKRPDLINVDAEKMLLAEKNDDKTLENYIHQYHYAGRYLDRREAIDFAATSQDPKAVELLKEAARDDYYGLRIYALSKLQRDNRALLKAMESTIAELAEKDPKTTVRAKALSILPVYADDRYEPIFRKNLNDSSYSVAGAALEGLMMIDSAEAIALAKKISTEKIKGKLQEAVVGILIVSNDPANFNVVANAFEKMPVSQGKFNLIRPLAKMLSSLDNTEQVKRGTDLIVKFRDSFPPEYGLTPYINKIFEDIVSMKKMKNTTAANEQAGYIQNQIN